MPRVNLFADESGDFTFSRNGSASKYFILTTVALSDFTRVNAELVDLRHALAWNKVEHPGPFHASSDPAPVRDRVFSLLENWDIRVDSLVIEKSKAAPKIRSTEERFYKYAWYYLMKFLIPRVCEGKKELLVAAASIGTKKKRSAFFSGVQDVMSQTGSIRYRIACWDAGSDCCIQVADYAGWAIQRKWERGDDHAYRRIEAKIQSEYDLFATGSKHYY